MRPSKQVKDAARQLITAEAIVLQLRPIVEKIQQHLLDMHEYRYDATIADRREYTNPLRNIKHTYMMCDADFGHYETELRIAYQAHGFTINDGECPLLVAEQAVRVAQRKLVEVSQSMHGIAALTVDNLLCAGLDKYKSYIDTTMQYVTQYL